MARLKLVFGIILALIAIPIFLIGIGMVTLLPLVQDSEGYYLTPSSRISESDGIGFVINFDIEQDDESRVNIDISDFATGKIWARSDTSIFVAIGPADEVEAYLIDQTYIIIEDLESDYGPGESRTTAEYTKTIHTAEAGPAGPIPNWETSKNGTDVTLKWGVKAGTWAVFVANEDFSNGFDVRFSVGAKIPILGAIGVGIFIFGSFLLIVAFLLIFFDIRQHRRKPAPAWAVRDLPPQVRHPPEALKEAPRELFCANCGAKYEEGDMFCTVCGDNLALADKTRFRDQTPYEEPHPQSAQLLVASGWSRFWAFIIDVIIIGAVIEGIRWLLWVITDSQEFFWTRGWPGGFFWSFGPWGIFSFTYWFLTEWKFGQSVGKMALGLEVVHMDSGKQPTDDEWLSVAISSIGKAFLLPIDLIVGWILQGKWKEEMGVDLQQRLLQRAGRLVVVRKRVTPPSAQFTSPK